MESGRARRDVAVWVWVAVGAAACALVAPLEPSLLEEGLIVHFAQRMVAGEHLYRDLVFFSGPLPFEALALLFRAFGEEIAVARLALAVLAGIATGSLYAIAARAGAGALSAAAAVCLAAAPIWLFPLYSSWFYTTLASHLGVIAAYAALRGVRSDAWAAGAGAVVAAVALCKQSVGVALALGLAGALWWNAPSGERARRAGWLVGGAAALGAATLALYALRGDLRALLDALVALPLELETSFSSPGVNWWPPGHFSPEVQRSQAFYLPHPWRLLAGEPEGASVPMVALTQALFALPWLSLALLGLRRWLAGPLPAAVWMHAAVLLAGIANLFPRADWGHLAFALPPAVCQLWITLAARPLAAAPRRLGALRVPALLVVTCVAVGSLSLALRLHRLAEPTALGERVPLRGVSRVYRDPGLGRVVDFLAGHARPQEAIFVARAEPLLYFATGTRNPTPYGGVLPARRSEQSERVLAALADVRFVVMSEIDQPFFLYYRDELPAVQAHLERFFQLPDAFAQRPSWIVVLERGGDRGETLVDLFDERASARAWIRDGTGRLRPHQVAPPKLATRGNRRPLPILLGAGGGGLDYELEVPASAWLRADLGLARIDGPDGTRRHAPDVRIEVSLREAGEAFRTLASWPATTQEAKGRAWTPVELDLGAWAGRRVTLRLAAIGERPLRAGTLAWLGSPVIVRR